jgi:hypothetical protein
VEYIINEISSSVELEFSYYFNQVKTQLSELHGKSIHVKTETEAVKVVFSRVIINVGDQLLSPEQTMKNTKVYVYMSS